MWSRETRQLIELAYDEDFGEAGDLTSLLLPDPAADFVARVVPREAGVICGLALGPAICDLFSRRLGQPLEFAPAAAGPREWQDGDAVTPGVSVALVRGAQAAVLGVERTLLNFLGRMSGVASLTRRYVQAARAANPDVRVLDTRKTIPGWRELDKYAVRAGGGRNHRLGLYDAVLVKDNHLAGVPTDRLASRLSELLSERWPAVVGRDDAPVGPEEEAVPPPAFIEVEVDDLAQFAQVCTMPAVDVVLLDNFPLDALRAAVRHRDALGLRGKLALEASGGVTLETIGAIAATGVDRISVGALTHAAVSLDLGLDS